MHFGGFANLSINVYLYNLLSIIQQYITTNPNDVTTKSYCSFVPTKQKGGFFQITEAVSLIVYKNQIITCIPVKS